MTAAFLATKVEEFNVSIEQFIANIHGNKERALSIVLNNELLLMKELNFHLTIHNPYRPVEGLLIDLKVHNTREHSWYIYLSSHFTFTDSLWNSDQVSGGFQERH